MPKVVDHAVYKEVLLVKSLPIFAKKGVSSLSMRELSRELEVSTGTLYHYFPTKEALFESMVKFVVNRDAKEIADLSEETANVTRLIEYLTPREGHFINLLLLVVDVKRHHSESLELNSLLEESLKSYYTALNRFFLQEGNEKAGEAFFSFVVGSVFVKFFRSQSIDWSDLFEGLTQFSRNFK